MTKNRRIRLLEDYIKLITKENTFLIGLAWVHSWRPDPSDVEEGERLRKLLKWEEKLEWEEKRKRRDNDKESD